MVAIKHTRPSPPAPRLAEQGPAGTGETYPIDELLRQATGLRLRAPELSMILGERAASLAEAAGLDKLWARAESLVVSARVRLGLRASTVSRAVAALRAAEDLGDPVLAAELRTDLAVCARSVGSPLIALASLRPVFAVDGFAGAARAAALTQLVGCLSQFGRKAELDRTLAEADRLCGADESLDGDLRLLMRALVRVGMSAHRRRHGDVVGAADAARTGLGLLEQLDDPRGDGGVVRNRLVLQLVCSLLDRGDPANALELAEPVLQEAERAASVAPLGWLRMAVATRVLLPAGSVEAAAGLLRDGIHSTERHNLHALTARLWAELAHVEERMGRLSEAIECLNQSRASEHLHTRARGQATGLLAGEFGPAGHAAVDLDEILRTESAAAPGSAAGTPSEKPVLRAWARATARPAVVDSGAGADGEDDGGGRRRREDVADDRGASDAEAGASVIGEAVAAPAPAPRASGDGEAGNAESGERRRRPRYKTAGDDEERSAAGQGVPVVRVPLPGLPAAAAELAGAAGRRHRADDPGDSNAGNADAGARRPAAILAGTAGEHTGDGPRVSGETGHRHKTASDDVRDEPAAAPSTTEASATPAVVRPLPVRLVTTAEADPPLAPAPADEPAPRVPPMSVWKAEVEPGQDESRSSREEAARVKTRHDAEHGSVAARSVLDRLGISTGSGGGRRRAADAGPAGNAQPDEDRDSAGGRNGHARPSTSGEPEEGASRGQLEAAGTSRQAGSPGNEGPQAPAVPGGAETPVESGWPRREAVGARTGKAETSAVAGTDTGADAAAESAAGAGNTGTRGTRRAAVAHNGSSGADLGNADATGPAASGGGGSEASGTGDVRGSKANDPQEKREQPAIEALLGPPGAELETPPAEEAPDTGEGWLPRLKLPPSLEPFGGYTDSALNAASGTPFTSAPRIADGELGEPFSADRSALEDDLPPDAGLGDLLARALAEHQAGTASAAALVKRLGSQGGDEPRPVNGHRRNGGGVTGNGRHRTDG